jgi:hypothetical protein
MKAKRLFWWRFGSENDTYGSAIPGQVSSSIQTPDNALEHVQQALALARQQD